MGWVDNTQQSEDIILMLFDIPAVDFLSVFFLV